MIEYDAIIIGSGLGGLSSAAVLAKDKKNVLLLEKNHYFGGYAVGFRKGNFKFDVSCHSVNKLSGINPDILGQCGIAKKISFIKPKLFYHSFSPGYDFACPQADPVKFEHIISSSFPKERRNISKLISLMSNIYSGFKKLSNAGSSYISYDLIKYANLPCLHVIDGVFKDKIVRNIFGQIYFFYGLSLEKISFLYFSNIFFDYICRGSYFLKGGANALVSELVTAIKKSGGRLIMNSEVKKIIIGEKGARGVITGDGKKYFCKTVISDISPHLLFSKLISRNRSANCIKSLNSLEPSISAFAVYLGTRSDYKKILPSEFLIFLNSGLSPDKEFFASEKCDFEHTSLAVTLFSNVDSSYAPKHKSSLSIITLSGYDFWKKLKKKEYILEKDRCADILIKRAQSILPGLSESIEIKAVASPLTMERYTGSYRGAIYGAAHTVRKFNLINLLHEAKIDNLYFAGAWSASGGGYLGALKSGVIAANSVLHRGRQ